MSAIQLLTNVAPKEVAAAGKSGTKPNEPGGIQAMFTNYMQQSSFSGAQLTKQQAAGTIEPSKSQSSGNVQQDYAQSQSKAAVQAEKINSTSAKAGETDTSVPEEVSEAVEEAVEAIKDIIKEELGIDDQQLEEAMELLGFTQADLFNPQQLTVLAVELTGSQDAGVMLFSESFQNILQQVSAVTEDLLQDLGMTMEQLMDQVDKMLETPTVQDLPDTQITPEMPQAKAVETMVTDNSDAPAPLQADTAQVTEAAGPIEVTADVRPAENVSEVPEDVQEVQVQQTEATKQQVSEVPQAQEEQPEENTQIRQVVQQEENAQAGQEDSELFDDTDAEPQSRNMQQDEHTVFDFHANVHQEQPVDMPAVNNTTAQAPAPQINVEDVIRQIAEYTRVNLTEQVKSIEMQLNPANLGKIFLHVTEKAGVVTAQITAQDENVKEALTQQAAILKDNLNQQGIKVNAVEVSVGAA